MHLTDKHWFWRNVVLVWEELISYWQKSFKKITSASTKSGTMRWTNKETNEAKKKIDSFKINPELLIGTLLVWVMLDVLNYTYIEHLFDWSAVIALPHNGGSSHAASWVSASRYPENTAPCVQKASGKNTSKLLHLCKNTHTLTLTHSGL